MSDQITPALISALLENMRLLTLAVAELTEQVARLRGTCDEGDEWKAESGDVSE